MRLYSLEVIPFKLRLEHLDLTCNRVCQCQLVHLYSCSSLRVLYLT